MRLLLLAPPVVTERQKQQTASQRAISMRKIPSYLQLADGILSNHRLCYFAAPMKRLLTAISEDFDTTGTWHHYSSTSGAVHTHFCTPLNFFLSPPFPTPTFLHLTCLCTDWIYFLQILLLSLASAFPNLFPVWYPLTMFYCFIVLGEPVGQEKKRYLKCIWLVSHANS